MQSAAVFSIGAPFQARSTLALVHGQGFRHLLFLEGVELRLLSPAARYQSDPSNLSAFFGRRRQHTPQDFTQSLQDILEGPFDTVGSLQRAYKFQQLAASDLMYGQRLIDESEGGHSVDDEYLRASHWRNSIEFLTRNKM
jgi:hypothetical protein